MDIQIRKGTMEDLDAFVDLLEEVHRGMLHKDWFYLDSRETFRELMEQGCMVFWLAMDDDRVAAAFDLLIPGLLPFNYGYELGFPPEQLMQVVNMDAAAVHPDYRGLGLQRRLIQTAEDWLGQGSGRILLCTVHPENCYSLQNAQACGYVVEKEIPIYGSTRCLLRKNLPEMEK